MHNEDLEVRFLEAWLGTGDKYLTRKEIAARFGRSDGWVQLMLIKTKAPPRRVSDINKHRIAYGADLRDWNKKKNTTKFLMRRDVRTLVESCDAYADATASRLSRKAALLKMNRAIQGLRRQADRLEKYDPYDGLLKEVRAFLNGDIQNIIVRWRDVLSKA
jgi:hypothetical protein